jgi:hypothetical protein
VSRRTSARPNFIRYLDKIVSSSTELARIYDDTDNSRKDEINSIMGAGPQLYRYHWWNFNRLTKRSIFYDKLKELRNYHRQFELQAEKPEDRVYFDVPSMKVVLFV